MDDVEKQVASLGKKLPTMDELKAAVLRKREELEAQLERLAHRNRNARALALGTPLAAAGRRSKVRNVPNEQKREQRAACLANQRAQRADALVERARLLAAGVPMGEALRRTRF